MKCNKLDNLKKYELKKFSQIPNVHRLLIHNPAILNMKNVLFFQNFKHSVESEV
jgi:hypothetical protein